MRRFATLFFSLALAWTALLAQDVDRSFIFVDADEEEIVNGSTVVRDVIDDDGDGNEVIYSDISVMNLSAAANDYLKMKYVVSQLDNGVYQLCFPTTCAMQTEVGAYETNPGQLMADIQDLMTEWFPTADGMCVVTLTIEVMSKSSGFPITYTHKAYGPSITIKFVKGGAPEPLKGDVNGDGEVNISDINAVIQAILTVDASNEAADVNGDGEVNISDVNAVIAIILNND